MTDQKWPEKKCDKCGKQIRFVRTHSGWMAFETREFKPHNCGHECDRIRFVPMFNPRKNRFDR